MTFYECSRLTKDKGASYIGEAIRPCRKAEVDRVGREGVDALDRNPVYREQGRRQGDPLIEAVEINRATPLWRLFHLVRATSATGALSRESHTSVPRQGIRAGALTPAHALPSSSAHFPHARETNRDTW
ncbi:hypothetical protein MTO96_049191 [Rhipicephalus appendiculatus]